MNLIVISIVIFFGILLIIFTIIRNQKDKKDLEKTLNNDYPKVIDQKGDLDEDGL